MKKKGTAFTIPEPCHEGWSNMTPVEKGRYCASCEKVVIDFSGMSDFQILNFMQEQRGSVCGRMSSQQLNRVMHLPQPATGYPVFSLRALVLGTALSAFTAIDTSAQKIVGEVEPVDPVPVEYPVTIKGEVVAYPDPVDPKVCSGAVIDGFSGDSLAGVAIALYTDDGTLVSTYGTDEKGMYSFSAGEEAATSYAVFMLSGYMPVTVRLEELAVSGTITLMEEPIILEGLIVPVEE